MSRHLGHLMNPLVPWCGKRKPGDEVVSETSDCEDCLAHQARFRSQLTRTVTLPVARARFRGRK